MTTTETRFPQDGRRVVFYLLYDERGDVDDYVPYKLQHLRPFADEIIVVVNGALTAEGRGILESVADEVWQRENTGFDVGGYSYVLERFGRERLTQFDELILMNYTWFGPVRPLEPLFERMNAMEVGFWGLTDHGPTTPHPFREGKGTMPAHIQSHWIAVRRSMFLSQDWADYWRTMPPITSYRDSIEYHESRFTKHFADLGHQFEVAFPYQNYAPGIHPAFLNAEQLLNDGCPAVKRRPLFHDPLYLDREAIVGRWLVDAATADGYPERFIWQSMSRSAAARVLYTNASMMEIMSSRSIEYETVLTQRVVVIAHIFYEEMTEGLLDRLALLPTPFDLVVTTSDSEKAGIIRAALAAHAPSRLKNSEVRVVESNRGRDQSAFYVTCRDVLLSDRYDLVVKVHSKKSVQDGQVRGGFFARQQLDNLLDSEAYAQNLLGMFDREPGLGVVYPPMIHIGFPTMGNAWFDNRDLAEETMTRLGIRVPLDEASPLAPYGGMFIARTAALRAMLGVDWTFDDYAQEGEYGDGTLSHVQERLVSYAAAESGYHTRTVSNLEYAAISHTFLEYKLDAMSHSIPGSAYDQIHIVNSLSDMIDGGRASVLKYLLQRYYPRLTGFLVKVMRPFRRSSVERKS